MAGHKPRNKPSTSASSSSSSTRNDRSKPKHKGGFKIGPKLGKGVYQGHAQKIKQTLIHKAKVKKEYAKELKKSGYTSTGANSIRPHDTLGDENEDERRTKMELEKKKNELRNSLYQGLDDGDENEQEADRRNSQEDDDDEEERGRGKNQPREMRVWGQPSKTTPIENDNIVAVNTETPIRSTSSTATSSTGRRSRPPPFFALPSNSAAAEQQKKKRPKLSQDEVEALKQSKMKQKQEWNKRGRNGQPKLGGRVEQLLARIQKGMQ